jgi:type I restriction enzyme M protein
VIRPLIDHNARLARTDFPGFNDPNKLGEGSAKVEKLSNLIAIFQKPELDFSKNRAEHDDILGDAYEYLMRHFATQSGMSKGQFYTPSEVSRIMAKVIGISPANTKASTTAYESHVRLRLVAWAKLDFCLDVPSLQIALFDRIGLFCRVHSVLSPDR